MEAVVDSARGRPVTDFESVFELVGQCAQFSRRGDWCLRGKA
jgi:hypothetical protein